MFHSATNMLLRLLPAGWEIPSSAIEILKREDGSEWLLGEGRFSKTYKAVKGGLQVDCALFALRSKGHLNLLVRRARLPVRLGNLSLQGACQSSFGAFSNSELQPQSFFRAFAGCCSQACEDHCQNAAFAWKGGSPYEVCQP